ncbi:MAG TPA: phage portal protein [Nitrospiraceae bacterium]|nr:phage portal protein [Nitrospiraceae bacterium]
MAKKPSGKIKAALLDWLGIPVGLTDGAFWSQTATNAAGQTVNEQTILKLTAVWACGRLISQTISTLPLGLFEKTTSGRSAAKNHSLYTIIHDRPNANSTAAMFWESFILSMLFHGNGFAEKLKIGNRLVGLKFLNPNCLHITQDLNLNYRYAYTENGRRREISEADIFHVPHFTMGGRWGLSAIRYGASTFGSALAADTAANSTFEKGLAPTVALTFPHFLKPEQREEFRGNLKKISGALNAGESPLLEGGMDAKVIGINPKDAQLLESRVFSGEDVCRWFGLDPSMVGYGGKVSNWGTGLEQKNLSLLNYCLRPIMIKIEQGILKDLILPQEQPRLYAEFNIEGLLRGDSAARKEFYASALQNGWMNRNQVAAMENQPSLEGGEIYTVQSNLIPIDQLGKGVPSETTVTGRV